MDEVEDGETFMLDDGWRLWWMMGKISDGWCIKFMMEQSDDG